LLAYPCKIRVNFCTAELFAQRTGWTDWAK